MQQQQATTVIPGVLARAVGLQRTTLFITARTSVYAVEMTVSRQ